MIQIMFLKPQKMPNTYLCFKSDYKIKIHAQKGLKLSKHSNEIKLLFKHRTHKAFSNLASFSLPSISAVVDLDKGNSVPKVAVAPRR